MTVQKYCFFLNFASLICIFRQKSVSLHSICILGNMTNKEIYREFCRRTPALPIFITDWWMDAVCAGKQWDVLLSFDEKGEIQAALPYLLRKRAWMKYIVMPQQTQIGGIWLREDVAASTLCVINICQAFNQALQEMGLSYYYQQYPIASPAIPAMQAHGFKCEPRITYRIEDLSDMEKVTQSFSKNQKRQLQKAQDLHVRTDMNIEDFYRFHAQCLHTLGKQINYTREFLLVLERKTRRLGQSQLISIYDKEEQVLAAAFLVWDQQTMYYLIPCYDPIYKNSGANALLVLEAIKLAAEKGLVFDFEGSMVKGTANFYKQFGSTERSYYGVEKYYHWYFWLANIYNKIRR